MTSSLEQFIQYTRTIKALEKNAITLKKEARLSIVLVFPNTYDVGMSNLGFQSLYRIFNNYEGVSCERAFYYPQFPEMARTIESAQQLSYFDVVAFSISFELDFLNVIRILTNAGINLYAGKRDSREPLIIAGGAISFINPQPIAPFMDLFYIGEIEPAADILIDHLFSMKEELRGKEYVLQQLTDHEGFYSPQFHQPQKKVLRMVVDKAYNQPQFSCIITRRSHFQEMFLVEVGRGCGRYCSFCAASHVYHPVRFFKKNQILDTIKNNIFATNKVGLVGAALCDYPDITGLCRCLADKNYQLGLSSFRFEAISHEFMQVIERAGIRTITLAPEAGTERLRGLINKRLDGDCIYSAMEIISHYKITHLKLYFLIGLPFEEEADIVGIIELVKKIRILFFKNVKSKKEIAVSVNAFVPKPFTPFQWSGMIDEKLIKAKRRFIEQELCKISGIKFIHKNARLEILQGILSLGDQRIADYLVDWASKKTVSDMAITDPLLELLYEKNFDQRLPWDIIQYSINKEQLWEKWQRIKHTVSE